ncbi:MAG: hypothetical protein WCX73_06115 [Candidatus Pacearchaeota archaeon]
MKKENKKIDKKIIGDIFNGILDVSQKEIIEKFPELSKTLSEVATQSPEDFNLEVFYNLEGVIRRLIANNMSKSDWDKGVSQVVFLYTNYNYIENNLSKFIEIKEGSSCSADKSGWLINALTNYYSKGTPIDMTISEKCYWKPHFWTAEQWIEAFKALHNFYYGGFNEYMLFLQKNWLPLLLEKENEKNSKSN